MEPKKEESPFKEDIIEKTESIEDQLKKAREESGVPERKTKVKKVVDVKISQARMDLITEVETLIKTDDIIKNFAIGMGAPINKKTGELKVSDLSDEILNELKTLSCL